MWPGLTAAWDIQVTFESMILPEQTGRILFLESALFF
jgi:hypothetical protein